MKASAYLSVFDDYELLGPAMAKIASRVDEIVVVDGAYRWMAPVFTAMGRDPTRSVDALRDVMAPYAAKTRWINRLWDNEPEKRAAGYAACSHRWIWRLDADEIHFIDDAALDRFHASGKAVAEMALPLYVAPGLVRGLPGQAFERNALLFDAGQIDAAAHLAHLWLVVPQTERLRIPPADPGAIAAEAISFTAHLTGWRPPATSVARARFYVMNWLREHGSAQPTSLHRHDPAAGFAPMLEELPPDALADTLLGHAIVAGLPELGAFSLMPSPLDALQEAPLLPLYAAYLDGLAALNRTLAHRPRRVVAGDEYRIDLSTPTAQAPLVQNGVFQIAAAEPIAAARAVIEDLFADAPFIQHIDCPVAIEGGAMRIVLPVAVRTSLRRVLRLTAWAAGGQRLLHLQS